MPVFAEIKKTEDSKLKKRWKEFRLRVRRRFYYGIVFPLWYRHCAKRPVNENKIVFVEVRYGEISNSLKTIYEELKANYDYEIKTCFLRRGYTFHQRVMARALYMLREIADAKYVVTCDGIDMWSRCKIRPETTIVQLWHACGAFKKFGMSTGDSKFGSSSSWQKKFSSYRHLKFVAVSSPEVVWAYEEAMQLEDFPGVVRPLGTSRTDVLYRDSFRKEAKERLDVLLDGAGDKKILLYAPTFRGRIAGAKAPCGLDIPKLCGELSDEWILLIKHHPMIRNLPEIPAQCRDFAYDVTDTMDIEDLYVVSDMCITDYSSVIYEYSIFGKPIIFFAYDLEEYFDWRGFYYPYDETFLPGPIVKTNDELIEYIKNPDRLGTGRVEAFRQKFMSACDGHATDRVIDEMTGGSCKEHRLPAPRDVIYEKDEDMRVSVTMAKDIAFGIIYGRLQKIYDSAAKSPVDQKRVVILADKKKGFSVMQGKLSGELSARGMDVEKLTIDSGRLAPSVLRSMEEGVRKFAGARFIVAEDSQSTILKKIRLRDETNIVYTQIIYDRFLQPGEYVNNFYDINRQRKIFCTSADVNILEEKIATGQIDGDLFTDSALKGKVQEKLKKKAGLYDQSKKTVLFIINTKEGMNADWDMISEKLSKKCNLLVYNKNALFEFKSGEGKKLSLISAGKFLRFSEAVAVADCVVSDHDLTAIFGLAGEKRIIFIGGRCDAMTLAIDDAPLRAFYKDNIYGEDGLAEEILAAIEGPENVLCGDPYVAEKYFPGCDGKASERLALFLTTGSRKIG